MLPPLSERGQEVGGRPRGVAARTVSPRIFWRIAGGSAATPSRGGSSDAAAGVSQAPVPDEGGASTGLPLPSAPLPSAETVHGRATSDDDDAPAPPKPFGMLSEKQARAELGAECGG